MSGTFFVSSIHMHVSLSSSKSPQEVLSQEATFLERLKTLNAGYFFCPDKALVNQLKVANPVELTKILNCFFAEMVQEGCITDPVQFLDRLASIVPLAKMQEMVPGDALTRAKKMFEEAKLYLQATQGSPSPTLQARLASILDGIVSVIESIIAAFGLGDFFKPAESEVHADMKSQKLMMLLTLFSMITSMILPVLGVATGGLIIGGILLGIAALGLIWPCIKPKPSHLPANAENWTKQVQNGELAAQGRKESLNEIADILKINRHAILVGPSRVGKSVTAKAFAQAVERGDYPELRGKVVFRIDTADLVGQKPSFLGGGNNILTRISTVMGRHRNDIILVFDEVHMACKHTAKIGDQLKRFLDEGGDFPHVIGITTEEEYERYVKDNNAFSLRFDKVDIRNMDRDETLKVLADTVLKSPSQPLITETALNYIYEKTSAIETATQPAASLKLLKQCINSTRKMQESPTEKKIIDLSHKALSFRSQTAACRGRKEVNTEIADLEKQIDDLQKILDKEREELNKLFKSKDLLDLVTKETYSSVIKIVSVSQKTLNAKGEKQLNLFLLLHEFLSRSLESHIEETAKVLGVRAVIDEALIDEVASA